MRIANRLRTQFLTGILAIIPVGVTIWFFAWVFNWIDNILDPIIDPMFGHHVPGVGFIVVIILVYLTGVVATNIVGRKLINYGESLLKRVPIVGLIYRSVKQIIDSFSVPSSAGFKQVVVVEFPMKGTRTLGFVTNESRDKSGERLLYIYIPTAPNPTSGFLQIVREKDVMNIDISVEDALKTVISAGKVLPQQISYKLSVTR